ncbi:MAG: hypothetical protein GXP42_07035 [Chloroflexi bacterium]|nr:hypothetical protein [Chloroflexota bacterium]
MIRTRFRAFLIFLVWPILFLAPTPHIVAEAQEGEPVISPRYHPSARFINDGIELNVHTQFWDGSKNYTIADLEALAPNFSLADHALRGYTMYVALPAGVTAEVAEVTGETIILDMSDAFGARKKAQLAAAETVGEPFWLRDQWVVRVRVRPLRRDAETGALIVMPDMRVRLDLVGTWWKLEPARPDPLWEPIYRETIVNYREGRYWRHAPKTPPDDAQTLQGAAPQPEPGGERLRVTVTEPGLHRITYQQLVGAGANLDDLDPAQWRMTMAAQPIPILVLGEEDGRFDPEDSILFYVPPWRPHYSRERTFWLLTGAGEGMRVRTREAASSEPGAIMPSFRDAVRLEKQLLYQSTASDAVGDRWFWLSVQPDRSGLASRTLSFDLPPGVWGVVDATLRLRMVGSNQGRLQAQAWINGFDAGSFEISNQQIVVYETAIPHFLLREKGNVLEIGASSLDAGRNAALLDWIEVEYARRLKAEDDRLRFHTNWPGAWQIWLEGFSQTPQVWDVSDPLAPVVVKNLAITTTPGGASWYGLGSESEALVFYEAATLEAMAQPTVTLAPLDIDLLAEEQQADYLIIAPQELLPAAQRLAAHRANQGLSAKVVPLDAIYDAFNGGDAHPQAIRAFLAYALARWQPPAPAFVTLLGDGHYDPVGFVSQEPVRIPVLLRVVDPWLKEVADENRYAAVAGEDEVPDLMLGRLPAQTLAEAEALVDKLIAYDALPRDASWLRVMLSVADEGDNAGDFAALANEAEDIVRATLDPRAFYLHVTHPNVDALRRDLLENWSQGALLVNYVGHGQPGAWSASRILTPEDLPQLQNEGRPALLLSMASLTGIFYWPNSRSLQEQMLLAADGRGIIGYVASTGYGLSTGNALIDEGFLQALVQKRVRHLGQAALQGKLRAYAQGYDYATYLLQLFTLIGDPATLIPLEPWPKQYYLPLYQK